MPRKKTTPEPPHLSLQNQPWGNLRSHRESTKELLKSPAWEDLRADLLDWREKQVRNLVTAKLDPQEVGKIQGVITFIDILTNLTL